LKIRSERCPLHIFKIERTPPREPCLCMPTCPRRPKFGKWNMGISTSAFPKTASNSRGFGSFGISTFLRSSLLRSSQFGRPPAPQAAACCRPQPSRHSSSQLDPSSVFAYQKSALGLLDFFCAFLDLLVDPKASGLTKICFLCDRFQKWRFKIII